MKACAKTEHWELNYQISNWTGEKENMYRGICFLADKKTLRIQGAGDVGSDDTLIVERGGKQIHVKRINSMLYVWNMLRGQRVDLM